MITCSRWSITGKIKDIKGYVQNARNHHYVKEGDSKLSG